MDQSLKTRADVIAHLIVSPQNSEAHIEAYEALAEMLKADPGAARAFLASRGTDSRVVLDLDRDNRPKVKIDGKDYRLTTRSRLPPLEAHALRKLGKRLTTLIQKEDDASEEELKELAALPDQMCRALLDAPDKVHEALTDRMRMAIVEIAVSDNLD